ncbi:MAG: hypothetical protein ABR574_02510 [Cryomorphaceae bacterium]|nr:hypothetical protein [Flavobacteriales bacterium]
MKNLSYICFIAAFITAGSVFGQCRSFVKKNCGDAMAEYVPAENFSAAKLFPGDVAEVKMTFYGGEDYRLLICSPPILGELVFQISDTEGNLLFDNAEHEMANHFDFQPAGTQDFIVKVVVPSENSSAIDPQGCVAIISGKKMEASN